MLLLACPNNLYSSNSNSLLTRRLVAFKTNNI